MFRRSGLLVSISEAIYGSMQDSIRYDLMKARDKKFDCCPVATTFRKSLQLQDFFVYALQFLPSCASSH